MSKRRDFTAAIARLITLGNEHGLELILDWTLRDAETQRRMFDKGLSKCDGVRVRSKHQFGTAADIYILADGKISNDREKYNWLHDRWDELGGGKRIPWDMGHFEFS